MTTISQTSVINARSYGRKHSQNLYNVVINAEDGNYQEIEIEADSFQEAEAKANAIAHETMIDIIYIEIYKLA